MRTFATKQPSNQDYAHQKPVRTTTPIARSTLLVRPARSPSLSTVSPGSTMLQRQPGCACGGGCPRCQEQALLQTKLKISEPGDQYEQEADRVADEVMRMPEPAIQPQMEAEEEMIQPKLITNQTTPLIQGQRMLQRSPDETTAKRADAPGVARVSDNPCPNFVSMSARVKNPTVSDSCKNKCRLGLGCCKTPRDQCGSTEDSGCTIAATVSTAEGCKGELAFMQDIVDSTRRRTLNQKTEECLTNKDSHDAGPPWKGCKLSVTSAGSHTLSTDDCPNISLKDNMIAASVTESFKTFLMWKPAVASDWTAIANVTWGWSGTTERQKGTGCAAWKSATGSHKDGDGKASRDRPAKNEKSQKWGSCKK